MTGAQLEAEYPDVVLVIRRVRRIGVLRLWRRVEPERWYVSLDNRTYHHVHEIDADRVERWQKEFGYEPPGQLRPR